MIISHSKETIILRTPKTGSTTLETCIRMTCDLKYDTYCSGIDDSHLKGIFYDKNHIDLHGYYKNLAISIDNKIGLYGRDASFTEEERSFIDVETQLKEKTMFSDKYYYNNFFNNIHYTLDDIMYDHSHNLFRRCNILTEEQINSYKIYAFIRNPLERVISSFLFTKDLQSKKDPMLAHMPIDENNFHEYVLSNNVPYAIVNCKQSNYHKYDDKRIVTPLLFEDFKKSIDTVVTHMGGVSPYELPRFKSKHIYENKIKKPTVDTWINPYPKIRDMLCEIYHEDIEMWEELSGKKV
tara:strand:+ start:96 stop:980 length:885 start_codon:yes stop_codon:yes gene_type:complete